MSPEVAIFQAILEDDQVHAADLMDKLSTQQLHELQRISLSMCALAREMILSGGTGKL